MTYADAGGSERRPTAVQTLVPSGAQPGQHGWFVICVWFAFSAAITCGQINSEPLNSGVSTLMSKEATDHVEKAPRSSVEFVTIARTGVMMRSHSKKTSRHARGGKVTAGRQQQISSDAVLEGVTDEGVQKQSGENGSSLEATTGGSTSVVSANASVGKSGGADGDNEVENSSGSELTEMTGRGGGDGGGSEEAGREERGKVDGNAPVLGAERTDSVEKDQDQNESRKGTETSRHGGWTGDGHDHALEHRVNLTEPSQLQAVGDRANISGAEHTEKPMGPARTVGNFSATDSAGKFVASVPSRSCPIAGVRPTFRSTHWVLLAVVVPPLTLLMLVVAQIRWQFLKTRPFAFFLSSSPVPPVPTWHLAIGQRRVASVSNGDGNGAARSAAFYRTTDTSGVAIRLDRASHHDSQPPFAFVFLLCLFVLLLNLDISANFATSPSFVVGTRQTLFTTRNATLLKRVFQTDWSRGNATRLVFAAKPLGGIVGVVWVSRSLIHRPRSTMVGACGWLFAGRVLSFFGLYYGSSLILFFSEGICGLCQGGAFLGLLLLAKHSCPEQRTQTFGCWEVGIAIGLLGGLSLNALLKRMALAHFEADVVGFCGVAVLATLSILLCIAMEIMLPSDEELRVSELLDSDSQPVSHFENMTPDDWLVTLVSSASTGVRVLIRLFLEGCAISILDTQYCASNEQAESWSLPAIVACALAQVIVVNVVAAVQITNRGLLRTFQIVQVCGLLLVFQSAPSVVSTTQGPMQSSIPSWNTWPFLLGSCLVYTGNFLTTAPLNSWSTTNGNDVPRTFFCIHITSQVIALVGSGLTRRLVETSPHHTTLVALLLPIVLAQVCLFEMGLGHSGETAQLKVTSGLRQRWSSLGLCASSFLTRRSNRGVQGH
eukprot:TRINITY_DN48711_c0_g1_i1.p1 TRINITY_DN48711_c0_g1~~TRINITY_DN48711_c0_g1_i1.p1  ORF type:complete len:887 (-),score=99.88 TRINITY_DN48711_c0_g1_i1:38-2698(-)